MFKKKKSKKKKSEIKREQKKKVMKICGNRIKIKKNPNKT